MPRFVVLDEADHDKPLGLSEACARLWASVVDYDHWRRVASDTLVAMRDGGWHVARSTLVAYSKHSYAVQCASCVDATESSDADPRTRGAVGSDGTVRGPIDPSTGPIEPTAWLGALVVVGSYLQRLAWHVPHGLLAMAGRCDRGEEGLLGADAIVDDDVCRLLAKDSSNDTTGDTNWTLQLRGGLVLADHNHTGVATASFAPCLQLNPPRVGAAFGGANAWFASIVVWTLIVSLLRLVHNASTGRKLHARECERYKKFL